ncbi:MAG: aminoacyl-tRNA hydrolase [Oscillospiraceae bacterium]|nr:aminoacyl-tRNA hydrolase [Oscillospiraceae bacterium]MBQ8978637.1 aminoacyl-tRNA hydrolase [Oscillospiraceae bacterium]
MSIFDIFDKIKKEEEPVGNVEYIIAGLGNPGLQYENTRHNAGFMTVDTLAGRLGFEIKRLRFKSLTADTVINGRRCLVMKPSTYMNESGQAIVEAMNFYKIPIENVIVCFDDISLEPGHIRIRKKGSDGGHNGIKSIIYLTGSDAFPRIKVGVGKKPHKDYDLKDWVLGNFPAEVLPDMHKATELACDCLALMVNGETDKAMNMVNRKEKADD